MVFRTNFRSFLSYCAYKNVSHNRFIFSFPSLIFVQWIIFRGQKIDKIWNSKFLTKYIVETIKDLMIFHIFEFYMQDMFWPFYLGLYLLARKYLASLQIPWVKWIVIMERCYLKNFARVLQFSDLICSLSSVKDFFLYAQIFLYLI
jgi:hypothetical protein